MERKTIVVCGATGNQGGAAVERLLASGKWNVAALSRNVASERAQDLKRKGVEIRQGDLLDAPSLRKAFHNVYGVFGVTQPFSPDYKKVNTEAEIVQGRNIVDGCAASGVKHLVLSTVMHFGKGRMGVPHVDSKMVIEEYAVKSGVPCTFLRPSSFMDNIGVPFFPVKKGSVRGFIDGDAKVPYISCNDIGAFAALAFERPEEYIGKEIALVSDFVSGEELVQTLSKLRNGERFKYKTLPRFIMRIFAKEFYAMRVAFEKWGRPPYPKEILEAMSECKRMHPDVLSVEQYLKAQGYQTKPL
jgi:uncharacterized protein YbjT (DUF2867 family)